MFVLLTVCFQILTLHFVVLSFDRYSRDDVVGEVMVEMENLDVKDSEVNPVSLIREISPRSMKVFSKSLVADSDCDDS